MFTEPFSLTLNASVTATTVSPWLWHNDGDADDPNDAGEFLWTLGSTNWNTSDGDDYNDLPDDAYGWRFADNVVMPPIPASPNIVDNAGGGHGAGIMRFALAALNGAGSAASRVRIMHVVGTASEITQYVIDKKVEDNVNIVAVSNSVASGDDFSRANAEDLAENDILLFVPGGTGINADISWGTGSSVAFSHATPRRGTQQAAVPTILPVTVNPTSTSAPSDYGINSFYFATPLGDAPSFVQPVGAVYAAIAVQAYQDAHSGQSPTAMQIKRAMMSGVDYASGTSNLGGRTITHDYDGSERVGGGLLELSDTVAGSLGIIESINQSSPEITDVSITEGGRDPEDPFGTTVQFDLFSIGSPSNWTISWGDNSFDNKSGIEIVDGDTDFVTHKYPFFENADHDYYPTIYAMSDADQVYLQASQVHVEIENPFAATVGPDHYVLDRDSNGKTRLTFGTLSHSFATNSSPSNELPDLILTLGANDTLLIDFTNGNMLANTKLQVLGTNSAGGVTVLGGAGADTITRTSIAEAEEQAFSVENSSFNAQFRMDGGLKVTLDGAGGNDSLSSRMTFPTTLIGGSGNDLASVDGAKFVDVFTLSNSDFSAMINGIGPFSIPFSGVENLHVNAGLDDDSIIVPADLGLPVTVDGEEGNDTLAFNGTSSADSITVAASTITRNSTVVTTTNTESRIINGGSGNDTITSASNIGNAVTINGDANTDSVVVTGTSSADSITVATNTVTSGSTVLTTATVESRIINGGNGADTINASTSSAGVSISGDGGNDALSGSSAADTINGGDGQDTISGNAGADTIGGGDEEETGDSINGNAGADNISSGSGNDYVNGGDDNDVIDGGIGDDNLYGGNHNDTITGGEGADYLYGEDGDDRLEAADGGTMDAVNGGSGDDYAVIDYDDLLDVEGWEFIEP